MNFNNSRLVDHKPMKFGTFVPYMNRFVIIVKYLTIFFKLEWNLGIKFTLLFFFLSVYLNRRVFVMSRKSSFRMTILLVVQYLYTTDWTEPQWQKTYLRTWSSSEDSDQPGHFCSAFTGCILDSQGCKVFFLRTTKTLIRLTDAQAKS